MPLPRVCGPQSAEQSTQCASKPQVLSREVHRPQHRLGGVAFRGMAFGIQAANAQKHIFIDKPIANNVKQATEMVKCCEENHVILSVGHNFRKSSCYRRIKEMINDGSIGKVVSVEGNLSHDGGLNLSPKDWRWFQNKCPSGPLIQLGIHQIDTLNYLLGPVKKVSAFSNHLYTPAEIKDVAVILLEYKSGILGYVGTNYVSPLISFTNIMATGANLFCENREKLYIQKKGSGNKENVVLENIDTELAEIDEFASCIRDGKKPEVDGKTAIVDDVA